MRGSPVAESSSPAGESAPGAVPLIVLASSVHNKKLSLYLIMIKNILSPLNTSISDEMTDNALR